MPSNNFPQISNFPICPNLDVWQFKYQPMLIQPSEFWELGSPTTERVSVVVGQYYGNYSIDIDITLTQAPVNLIYLMKFSHPQILHCLFRTLCLSLLTIKEN